MIGCDECRTFEKKELLWCCEGVGESGERMAEMSGSETQLNGMKELDESVFV